jgi:hypothetical protein
VRNVMLGRNSQSSIIGTLTVILAFILAPCAQGAHSTVCGIKSEPVNEHCYALSDWQMTNGETVKGESVKIDTITDENPGYYEGDFFSNEVWAGFDKGKHWAESGQYTETNTGMHYFWAYENGEGYHEEHPWYPEGPALNTWNTYKMLSEPNKGANAWGIWINGTGVQVAYGMEPTSTELEAGIEMTDTNIWNSMESTEALNLGTQGEWWNGWQATGTGNYAHPAKFGPKEPNVPNCVKEINHAWAYYYGAQPCGDNGPAEPGVVKDQNVSTPGVEGLEPELKPSTPEAAALVWSGKSGDSTPTSIVEKTNDTFELHGNFVAHGPIPPHAETPTGTVMILTIDPATNSVVRETLR